MANNLYITNAVAQDLLQALKDAIDSGANAVIEIYDGTQPADADAAISGPTKLAELNMAATAFGAISDANPGAEMTAASISDDNSADASGTATWFQILIAAGSTVVLRGSVGTSNADIVFDTVTFTAGSTISITSMKITQPES